MKVYKADVLDRLSITLLKKAHGTQGLQEEIDDLLSEIKGTERDKLVMLLAMVNATIFANEGEVRNMSEISQLRDEDLIKLGKKLLYTHKLNATRSQIKAMIAEYDNERVDPKLNYVKGEWVI